MVDTEHRSQEKNFCWTKKETEKSKIKDQLEKMQRKHVLRADKICFTQYVTALQNRLP